MVEINNLTFYYRERKPIFENVSFEMKNGIYGLLGENGVGKTTLLRIISGLCFPKKGSCQVLGAETAFRNPDMLKQLYYLPEEFIVPSQTVKNFVKLNSVFYPNFSNEQFNSYLNDFHLDIDSRMKELSFGQKKKVLIAFAISLNTPVTLLDEPTNGLDIPSKSQFRKVIASAFDEDKCILISTHQVRDLESLIDPIIILDRNQVLLNNTVEEISKKLLFTYSTTRPQDALFSEQTMLGYTSVLENKYNEESTLNIEALFNAVVTNKEKIRNIFNA
ncbi:ABC transporter ATP-binding protein [Dysgonomonas sp. 37-18]|mgnify:FL=1|uniref:ABC transporter ATP-binding protein n=1 Tax=Dysgonomonas sp. 37-18 TaxID=1895907 RepID=UPI0009297718|nr:ABC transporter ATP-binding protein [Dysgonomonas sp. 37-18]OJX58491.1 MAG: ABC transporter ATP-binding protein [Dysgonomonas sp. 37-18]